MRQYYRNLKRRRIEQYRINKVFYRKLVENHPELTIPDFDQITVTPVEQIYEMIHIMMVAKHVNDLVVRQANSWLTHWQPDHAIES